MKRLRILLGNALLAVVVAESVCAVEPGQFWRVHWYQRGLEHGNPAYEQRFRVNSPDVVVHPVFGKRIEARENGLMLIRAEEDLSLISAAELYLELWGGHPGTANKRVTVNGRSTYFLPRAGTEEMHCTYHYPAVSLKRTDLVNGYNAFQFAVDQGETFWGHMLIDNACLRVALDPAHPDLAAAGLGRFIATVEARSAENQPDAINVSLQIIQGDLNEVESVEFTGFYFGYDENGDGRAKDWHGFTKSRKPIAILAVDREAPFQLVWKTSMIPSQKEVAVRAAIRFKAHTNLVYITAPVGGLGIPERANEQVFLVPAQDLPEPFWSRAGQKRECMLYLNIDPSLISEAELHVTAWTGGAGSIKEYFKLNGRHFPIAEGSRHELIYSRLPVEPAHLRQGANRIELLSDTDHHGIEILLPGPALMVRSRKEGIVEAPAGPRHETRHGY